MQLASRRGGSSTVAGCLFESEVVYLLRTREVMPAIFLRFIGVPPAGRGHQKFEPAIRAADNLWRLAHHRLADPRSELAASLDNPDKRVRHDAALALALVHHAFH